MEGADLFVILRLVKENCLNPYLNEMAYSVSNLYHKILREIAWRLMTVTTTLFSS